MPKRHFDVSLYVMVKKKKSMPNAFLLETLLYNANFSPPSTDPQFNFLPCPIAKQQEANSRITRFILICNYVTRIIEPLASRCAKFRFAPLPPASMKERLNTIAKSEGCQQAEIDLLDDILDQADGDMRRAVTTLQSVHSLAAGGEPVSRDMLSEIAGHPPPTVLQLLWDEVLAKSSSFDAMQEAVQDVCAQGYAAKFLLLAMLPYVAESTVLTERHKSEIALRMAQAEKNMVEGADEFLQLMTVCSLVFTCFRQAAASAN